MLMAFMSFLVTTSVKFLLLCIPQVSKIKLHFHLLHFVDMANNSGVAFSLLISI